MSIHLRQLLITALPAACVLGLSGCVVAPAPTRPVTYVEPPLVQPEPIAVPWAPPPTLAEVPPPPPYTGAVWIGGYWVWQGHWAWAAGHWHAPGTVLAPPPPAGYMPNRPQPMPAITPQPPRLQNGPSVQPPSAVGQRPVIVPAPAAQQTPQAQQDQRRPILPPGNRPPQQNGDRRDDRDKKDRDQR